MGLILLLLGCTVFGVGLQGLSKPARQAEVDRFISVNIWLLLFLPLSLGWNFLCWGSWDAIWVYAPYPRVWGTELFAFCLVYGVICLGVDLYIAHERKLAQKSDG